MFFKRNILAAALVFAAFACTNDKGKVVYGSGYPNDVAEIVVTHCAASGCHNDKSRDAAAGLSLQTWEMCMRGGRNGPAVIPFRPDYSTLCYYTNTNSGFGPMLQPTMPLNRSVLSLEQYLTLKNWIQSGAPSSTGQILKSAVGNCLYVTNQLCDIVMITDRHSKNTVACVDVGILPRNEFPVCAKVAPDRSFWAVSFLGSPVMQIFDCATNDLVKTIQLGDGTWSSFSISNDSKTVYCADRRMNGRIAKVDILKGNVVEYFSSPYLVYSRGIVCVSTLNKIYSGNENGNYISVTDIKTGTTDAVILDGTENVITSTAEDPVFLYADESARRIFISCRGSMEVKILDIESDTVIGTVKLNTSPGFSDYSPSRKLLFVACTDDSISVPGLKGSVKIIDVGTGKVIQSLHTGFQPNGISVDEETGIVTVVNSNTSPAGPRPHHVSACAGRNGYLTFIDLKTLELVNGLKRELAVYPYSIASGR